MPEPNNLGELFASGRSTVDNAITGIDSTSYRYAFSGADIHAYVGSRYIGNLVSLTVSITREVMPLYTFGDPSPKTFVKGKRGIAGAMTFTQFDKHALIGSVFAFDNIEALWTAIRNASSLPPELSEIRSKIQQLYEEGSGDSKEMGFVRNLINRAREIVGTRPIRYVDQIPPFDLTLAFVNESGAFAYLELYNVQFVNEGFGYTLDDLASEIAVTYVATGLKPLSNTLSYTPAQSPSKPRTGMSV